MSSDGGPNQLVFMSFSFGTNQINAYGFHINGHYFFEIIEYLSYFLFYFLLIHQRLNNSQPAKPRIRSQCRGLNSKEFSKSYRKA